jgi:hypothetical protein
MSKFLHYFESSNRKWIVPLGFELDDFLAQWGSLRPAMIRSMPAEFARDEWAYLISFLDPHQLLKPFDQSFGKRRGPFANESATLARPRKQVSVWLPGNVSLLGPLVLIYVSFAGAAIRMKSSSEASDLAGAFLNFARENLAAGTLKNFLHDRVKIEQFPREDPRNREMAAQADVRIVFGSDQAVGAIDALPHPANSINIAFGDHTSQAWIFPQSIDADLVQTLIKVFAIYGQAGCTSPRRVILINGTQADATQLRDAICDAWPTMMTRQVPMHVASGNILGSQLATAYGWNSRLAPRNASVICAGSIELEDPQSLMTLPISFAPLEEAVKRLPKNIQTIGYAPPDALDENWYSLMAQTDVKRVVPLAKMHHFGPTWDGIPFWRQLFEEAELQR